MNLVVQAVRTWIRDLVGVWDRFWFTPSAPHTLAMIRIFAGMMLFYTHLVWSKDLMNFLGPNAWIPADVSREINLSEHAWSYLWYVESPALLWTLHISALVVFAMLTLGLFTRVTSILACVITLSYIHRLNGALFGLDNVNSMLAIYLMIGSAGGAYSLDRLLAKRRNPTNSAPRANVSTNIAIRLIQLHMCVIYMFGGIAKMKGLDWWNGSAVWFAVANYEYQSLDMTWMVHFPWLIALLTHITVFWETFYCVLVWPRLLRPIVLAIAVGVHGGIALFLGMITFGLAMLIGNFAFVSPRIVDGVVRWAFKKRRAGEGRESQPAQSMQKEPQPVAS